MSIQKELSQLSALPDGNAPEPEIVKLMRGLTFSAMKRTNGYEDKWEPVEGKFRFLKIRAVTEEYEYGVFTCGKWFADFYRPHGDSQWYLVENPNICLSADFIDY